MFERELAIALGLADRAGAIAMGLFRGDGLEVRLKADLSMVTEADTSIEAMLRQQLAVAFPDDRVLGEEEGGSVEGAGRIWIVDPIDGTSNFARGVPAWGTLIALQNDGVSVLGVCDMPALGERYAAVRGYGATCNDRPIRVSEIATVADSHLLYAEMKDLLDGPYREPVLGLIADCWRDRGFGDCWAHALVARGAAEVMLEPELSLWDYAAMQVIVEEAGGRMTTFDGGPPVHGGSVVSTNGVIHDAVLERLARP
ncbi:MAG: histidinol-phosphatase [Actinomycetota bacterium]|jgi:histidinol-phosphatase|nr:histidinol-phosphatase [Actinomycetota bacterium]